MAKTYYDHKPIIQTASPGFKANPLDSDIIKSPCRCHPILGGDCPNLKEDKSNYECQNCGPLGKGNCWRPGEFFERVQFEKPPLDKPGRPAGGKNQWTGSKKKPCKFPGCDVLVNKGYCRSGGHSQLVGARKREHIRIYGTEASIEWLHRPKTNRGRPKKGEIDDAEM